MVPVIFCSHTHTHLHTLESICFLGKGHSFCPHSLQKCRNVFYSGIRLLLLSPLSCFLFLSVSFFRSLQCGVSAYTSHCSVFLYKHPASSSFLLLLVCGDVWFIIWCGNSTRKSLVADLLALSLFIQLHPEASHQPVGTILFFFSVSLSPLILPHSPFV